MMDLPEDTRGKSTYIRGREERIWSKIVDKFDLIDSYLVASQRKGPLFTRQKHYGLRFNQSRLDQIYSSNSGAWFEHISRMEHDGRETLSDHIPVVCTFVFTEAIETGLKRGSYLKLDHRMLSDPEFMMRIQ